MLDQEVDNKDRVPMDESFIVAAAQGKARPRKREAPLLKIEFPSRLRVGLVIRSAR
jgi:hypothetical protein